MLHLFVAPLVWPGVTLLVRTLSRIVLPPALQAFPLTEEQVKGKSMYAVHVPEPFAALYVPVVRRVFGYTVPQVWHPLCMVPCDVRMTRESATTFVLEPLDGTFLSTTPETLLRSDAHPLAAGDVVRLPGVTATVLTTVNGRPAAVRFDLGQPLEDTNVVLLVYEIDRLRVLTPPAIGESVVLSTGWDAMTPLDVLRWVLTLPPVPAPRDLRRGGLDTKVDSAVVYPYSLDVGPLGCVCCPTRIGSRAERTQQRSLNHAHATVRRRPD